MHRSAAIDPQGILQLVGAGLIGGLFGYFLTILVSGRTPFSPAIPVIVSAGCAVAALVILSWTWRREGGRQAILETNGWIRDRRIPSDVPEQRWRLRLARRESRASGQWIFLVSACLWIPFGILQIFEHRRFPDAAVWFVAIGFYLLMSARVIYYNLRWLPVIRKLLAERDAAEWEPEPQPQP